jgi:phytoene synthase
MSAIYAFMRRSDDIADGAGNPARAVAGLRQWRQQVDDALAGRAFADPSLPALVDTVNRYRIEPQHLHQLLDGAEMDQFKTRYATFDELYRYCYHVASVVGLVVLPVFGSHDPPARQAGEACGIAFQLTNILRDVKEDAQLGRIYLPTEDLTRFGVSENDIMDHRYTPAFVRLMQFEAERARQYYARARPLLELVPPDSRATLAVMMDIYRRLLDKIEAARFDVFADRVRLSVAEKLWIVARNGIKYRA